MAIIYNSFILFVRTKAFISIVSLICKCNRLNYKPFVFKLLEKPQEEKKDTFAEKLATQVIKNLQVKITSIHIRYEDDVSVDSPNMMPALHLYAFLNVVFK